MGVGLFRRLWEHIFGLWVVVQHHMHLESGHAASEALVSNVQCTVGTYASATAVTCAAAAESAAGDKLQESVATVRQSWLARWV